jgi:DNA-binding CsgD family transcriptional regulator
MNVSPLLELIAAPAYVTDRLNHVRAVNDAYRRLVGDPIADGYAGDELFVTRLILGPYRNHFPRRVADVAGWAPFMPLEVDAGRLTPEIAFQFERALMLDSAAVEMAHRIRSGTRSPHWNGLILFQDDEGHKCELQESVISLVTDDGNIEAPAYLNVWLDADDSPKPPMTTLSSREQEIASLFTMGLNAREVAERAGISLHTARDHRDNIYAKLGAHSRLELARILGSTP